ncbi:MAG: T9SS type A sorting domain-containing protein, partial [Flavobacteriales bacterium]
IGFNYPGYTIYKFTSSTGWNTLESVASNIQSYTDTISTDDSIAYAVEAIPPFVCQASKAKNFNSTRSNNQTIKQLSGNDTDTSSSDTSTFVRKNEKHEMNMNVYPNPSSSGEFTLELSSTVPVNSARLKLMSMQGKVIMEKELPQFSEEYTEKIQLKEKANGVYFLQLISSKGSFHKKLIIQH